ncbi:type I polyketide synthase [Actinomadura latina]|uniref:Type I polyketide synthase n=1 Tax=Actinomadura latina TaxID=163603 RepID=A0A846YY93_9ACTN|nr:type I polyketide synthase [Actinomadura latina]NKZ03438.1 type I polyketide synthase [Actinomadura latina]
MSSYPSESIAIIGMAARFPGAQDLDEFWSNLRKGKECIVFPSDAELLAAGVPPELLADSSYVKAHAETPDIESFDAEFFGFTPRDAAILDPQIRMFMEVCHDAVEQAGYDPAKIGDGVGVFGATGVNNYLDLHIRSGSGYQMLSATGVAASALSYPDYVATHVAYRFGFRGPALTVSTACSSSAVAVHLACQALRLGECDHAIAGGSEVEMPARQGYQWDAGGPLSADGHCRPFDRLAGGTVFSSGAGAVLLKRLEDAIADGDHVWAVIRSSAVNNDGATKAGFAAPGIPGQAAAVTEAISLAGLTARDLDFVEAHGTGTALGDPVEVAALATAFRNCGGGERPGSAGLSSVKGNIGHLGHASGIASIVKTALCLRHEERVPTVNFVEPNPRLEIGKTPFRVDAATIAWPRSDRPRIAGVNSLGFGGTNAHLILAEGPVDHRTPGSGRPEVVIWSARAERAAADYRQALTEHLSEADDDAFCDIVGVLQEGRTEHPVRRAIVAGDAAEAVECLKAGEILAHDADGGTGETPRQIVFAFPGQGSQHSRMASGLYGREPVFTKVFDECLEGFERAGTAAEPLRDTWLGGDETAVNSTLTAQPLLFAVEMALTAMWSSWGIEPDVVVGHSLGEITAGAVAGVFTLDEAIRLVHARARAMAALPGGAMAAVTAPPDRVADVLGGTPAIAVVNAPDQTVIAGTAEEIDAALTALSAANLRGRRIATSHAFHSPSMSPAVAEFAAAFAEVDPRPPAIPIISASTGAAVGDEARDPMFWAAQIAEPVRFDLALAALPDQHGTLVLEAGPGQVLTALVRAGLREAATVPTLPHRDGPETDLRSALSAVATVWVNGHRVDWANVRLGRPVRRVPVPGYRYQRKRHWIEPSPRTSGPGAEAGSSASASALRAGTAPGSGSAEVGDDRPFSVLTWTADPNPGSRRTVGDRGLALVLLPADEAAGMTAVLALQRAGHRIAVVRPGARFEETDGEFRVRLDDAADIDRVFRRLADRGQPVSTLVHALALTDWPRPTPDNIDELLTLGHHGLSLLVQRGARHITAPEVLVLADSSADITGAEPAHPVKAALHGAVRSLAQEAPEMRCRLLDLAAVTAEGLAAELAAAGGPTVIALRGPRRWIRTERSYLPGEPDRPAIRHRGVYLITGGFGGLGTEVARSIAATGMAPRLILVGRSLPPDRRLAELTRCIERLGGTVQAEACNVGDQRAMRRIFDTARARHGAVHGVLHLAGVPGDTMLLRRERQDAAAVLWPKVRGALVLEKVLQKQPPLDFLVMFSSRAAVSGLVGGADYAAANCFGEGRPGVHQDPSSSSSCRLRPRRPNSTPLHIPGVLRQVLEPARLAWGSVFTRRRQQCPREPVEQ